MRMTRSLEPVDLMVAVGVCATVLAAYLLFISTSGTLAAATPESASIGLGLGSMDEMDWVQPALGQAIVDDYLLGREASRKTAATVTKLNRATMIGQYLQASPFGHLKQISDHATMVEAKHAARVQFVLGRSIVDFTTRGIRTGALSPGQYSGEYNRRMIRVAEATGRRMDQMFRSNRQANLERAILVANQDHAQFVEQIQQRIGAAIVQVARIQYGYQEAMGALQGQVAATAIAAIRTELRADLFARLAAADRMAQQPTLPLAETRSWPETPVGFLFAASAALIGLFLVGLLMPTVRPESEAKGEVRPEVRGEVYRKTG